MTTQPPKLAKIITDLDASIKQTKDLHKGLVSSPDYETLRKALEQVAGGNPPLFHPAIFGKLQETTLTAQNPYWTADEIKQLGETVEKLSKIGLKINMGKIHTTEFVPARANSYGNTTPAHQETTSSWQLSVDLAQENFFANLAKALWLVRIEKMQEPAESMQENEAVRRITAGVDKLVEQLVGSHGIAI